MTGAEYLMKSLALEGVDVCFANPGTSEMHLVGALESTPEIRPVLCLFEGVATAAADGYSRMTGRPASTILHLGPGLGNGAANLHNARRGFSAIVNIVGEHATFHVENNAPLTTDLAAAAAPFSDAVSYIEDASKLKERVREAIAEVKTGQGRVVTLAVPSDVAWGECADVPAPVPTPQSSDTDGVGEAAAALEDGTRAAILLGGVIPETSLMSAAKITKKTGARLLVDPHVSRMIRGAGTPAFERVEYFPEQAVEQLADIETMVCAGAPSPVAFFGYPNSASSLVAEGCRIVTLAPPGECINPGLTALEAQLGAGGKSPELNTLAIPDAPTGALTRAAAAESIVHCAPDDAIMLDESITSGGPLYTLTTSGRKHDWLRLTGGAIGWGLPAAVGAAVACPDRKVLCFEGDGSAMYTIQALWTMARENLDVTSVIFANRNYTILQIEYGRMGFDPTAPSVQPLMNLEKPPIEFAELARSMGVTAVRAETADEFHGAMQDAMANPGPNVIETVLAEG